jgi:hypothetical protein
MEDKLMISLEDVEEDDILTMETPCPPEQVLLEKVMLVPLCPIMG